MPEGRPETPIADARPTRDGIVEAIGDLSGRNLVAAAFYDGPGWARFRPWERLFLTIQGGNRRARRQVLRDLPETPAATVLEVGIGDGENLPLLPKEWEVHGVDVARTRLVACLARFPGLAGRLAWAEGERLPHEDESFDLAYSIGGFNYFGDPPAVLREMARVVRPGGTLVVADEVPWLARCGIGHLVGRPAIDGAWLRAIGLDRDFAKMVLEPPIDLATTFGAGWKRRRTWGGLGYCMTRRLPGDRRGES